jgi:hypothetical protein
VEAVINTAQNQRSPDVGYRLILAGWSMLEGKAALLRADVQRLPYQGTAPNSLLNVVDENLIFLANTGTEIGQ